MLVIIEGESLGVVVTDYDADDGTKAQAYKLRLLQADASTVDIRLPAKDAQVLAHARSLKKLAPVLVECTVREAEQKDGRYGRYLAKATYTFKGIPDFGSASKPAAVA